MVKYLEYSGLFRVDLDLLVFLTLKCEIFYYTFYCIILGLVTTKGGI